MKRALVRRAVPEHGEADLAGFTHPDAQAHPHRHRQAAPHDAVAAQVAVRHVRDVHGAAAPPTKARLPPHDVRHDAVRVVAPGQKMPVSPVVAEQIVSLLERADHPHVGGLLTDRQVQGAVRLALLIEPIGLLLELADELHLAQHVFQDVGL